MENKNTSPESLLATREQEIISLYYHNELSVYEISKKLGLTQEFIASVLISSTIKIEVEQTKYLTIESRLNYDTRI